MNRTCNICVAIYLVIIIVASGYCIIDTPSQGIYHAVDWVQSRAEPRKMTVMERIRAHRFALECLEAQN